MTAVSGGDLDDGAWAGWLATAQAWTAAGDPRGELLALEHRTVAGETAEERDRAQARIDELLRTHAAAWALDREEAGWSYATRCAHLALLARARRAWNRGRGDRFGALAAAPALHLYVAPAGGGSPLADHHQLLIDAALARIAAAFDGRPPPGPGQRTLSQAEAADSRREPPDRSVDHDGRWQDLPDADLLANQWALAHLDADALRYYLPAFMTFTLRHRFSELPCGALIENTRWSVSRHGEDLRDHVRRKRRSLDASERVAIATFAAVLGDAGVFEPWARVVEAELGGARADWFDVFWPDRPRPALAGVRAAVVEAFADVRAPDGLAPARWQDLDRRAARDLARAIDRDGQPGSTAERLVYVLPALMVAALDGRGSVIETVDDLLQSDLRPEARERLVLRFARLDRRQRAAIDGYLRRCSERQSVRHRWATIAEREASGERADWCEPLFEPWDGPAATRNE